MTPGPHTHWNAAHRHGTYTHIHTHWNTHIHRHMHARTHTHTHWNTHILAYTRTYSRSQTHTHTHTVTLAPRLQPQVPVPLRPSRLCPVCRCADAVLSDGRVQVPHVRMRHVLPILSRVTPTASAERRRPPWTILWRHQGSRRLLVNGPAVRAVGRGGTPASGTRWQRRATPVSPSSDRWRSRAAWTFPPWFRRRRVVSWFNWVGAVI